MINITPLRRTIRHLAQRLRMEGETFIIQISLLAACLMTAKGLIILVIFLSVYIFYGCLQVHSQDSQDEGITFGDGNCMFKMRRQRTICRNNRPFIWQDAGFMRPN
jgi:hypothetical protein